jgi:hypothetical protein
MGGCAIIVVGVILACDEDAFRFGFEAGDSAPSLQFGISSNSCVAKARVDEEILQHVVQRRADVLPREPRWMREAPRRAEQYMGLRRRCE